MPARASQLKLAGDLVFNMIPCYRNYQRPIEQKKDRHMDLKPLSFCSGDRSASLLTQVLIWEEVGEEKSKNKNKKTPTKTLYLQDAKKNG